MAEPVNSLLVFTKNWGFVGVAVQKPSPLAGGNVENLLMGLLDKHSEWLENEGESNPSSSCFLSGFDVASFSDSFVAAVKEDKKAFKKPKGRKVFPDDVLPLVFAFLVDAQSICNIQRTCRTTRRWKYDKLHEWKLDWVYKNVKNVLGAEETKQLRDGLLTKINLNRNNIGDEGAKAIGEALKVNTSLTLILLSSNEIGDEGGKAIGEALKVNTS
eukprot:g11864.t1